MKKKLSLVLAGRCKDALTNIETHLTSRESLDVHLRHVVNGHADPLHDVVDLPDILVLYIDGLEGGELEALLERPASMRPPMIVISETDDAAAMRVAMKAGARDFLPVSNADGVLESIDAVVDDLTEHSSREGELVAVINAKGGAGATFVACNLAHLAVSASEEPTALVGLDMQFPTLPAYFDTKLEHGLIRAIENVDTLDAVALEAIMGSHSSGLKLLAARPDDFRFSFESLAEPANRLFDLLQQHYQHVVVDMPRQLDELTAQVASRASRILLVVQQSLPHVQDATRLRQLMRDQLGIPAEKLLIVVNRYVKGGEIELADIEKALPGSSVVTVPNHFKAVSESINLGVPMYEHARSSAVTKSLLKLQHQALGRARADHPALAAGKLSSLLQKTPLQQFFGGK